MEQWTKFSEHVRLQRVQVRKTEWKQALCMHQSVITLAQPLEPRLWTGQPTKEALSLACCLRLGCDSGWDQVYWVVVGY